MARVAPLLFSFACVAGLAARPASATIFEFTDEHGVRHYTNVPDDSRYRVLYASPQSAPAPAPANLHELVRRSAPYAPLIEGAARVNGLEPALVRAVLVAESGGDAKAISKRGALGLMQLMPATARHYGVTNVFDPEQNIRAGSQYLRDLAARYRNDLELVLAAYNAGPAAVDQHGGTIPQLQETLDYVPRVMRIYRHLLQLGQP